MNMRIKTVRNFTQSETKNKETTNERSGISVKEQPIKAVKTISKLSKRTKMYGLENKDIEAMALAPTANNVIGVPKTSILPDIIRMSATN